MKEEYYQYIDLCVLTRADVYYINGYYFKASFLYRRALQKALLYNGKLKSIDYAIKNIEKQLQRCDVKCKQNRNERNTLIHYLTYYKYSLKGYYYAFLKKRLFIY